MPRILDKNGRELAEGASVERNINGRAGGVVGKVLAATKLDVLVEWPGPSRRFYRPERHTVLTRDRVCPDLQLAKPPREEAAKAAPERSTA